MMRKALIQASTRRFSPSLFLRSSLSQLSASYTSCQIPTSQIIEQLQDSPEPSPPSTSISVDRSTLYHPPEHSHEKCGDSEIVKHLKNIIKFRGGPITVAEYMEEVLTNPKAGFYMNRDVFGAEGDFITSPEVSQMFGEMVSVWAMCLWEQMGQPSIVNLVELGPGRGTLLADLLRGASKFKKFTVSLHIHMVECSPALQKLQYQNLKCTDSIGENVEKRTISELTGNPVSWHTMFEQPTPATLYLLKRFKWEITEEIAKLSRVEICPKAMDLTQAITQRIGSDGGGALIIDYGLNGIVSDSLQAIRKHKFVDILDTPGSDDFSVYVDFPAIKYSAEVTSDVTVHGPITQSQFLGSLGINFRVEALLENCSEEQAESLRTGYWRLVGEGEAPFWEGPDETTPIGMGSRYLAMAIVNKKQGVPVPFL